MSELEFQRFKSRKLLSNALINCDLVQVISGSPAWALSVVNLGIPVSLQVATLVKVERRLRDKDSKNLLDFWRKFMTMITSNMEVKALKSVNAIQVENSWMFEHVKKINHLKATDIRFSPPGVDTDCYIPLEKRPNYKSSYFLCVGRLSDARKNIDKFK